MVSTFDTFASSYDLWYETPLGRLVDRLEKDAVFALVDPFRPGTFDLVTVILGLEFAAGPVKTLEEVRRILKPGATLVERYEAFGARRMPARATFLAMSGRRP